MVSACGPGDNGRVPVSGVVTCHGILRLIAASPRDALMFFPVQPFTWFCVIGTIPSRKRHGFITWAESGLALPGRPAALKRKHYYMQVRFWGTRGSIATPGE